MYRLESMSNGAEIQSVLAELMEKYQSEVVSFSNEEVLYRALHGLAYFSYEYVDEKYNVLLWFAGVLYDSKERCCWGLVVFEVLLVICFIHLVLLLVMMLQKKWVKFMV